MEPSPFLTMKVGYLAVIAHLYQICLGQNEKYPVNPMVKCILECHLKCNYDDKYDYLNWRKARWQKPVGLLSDMMKVAGIATMNGFLPLITYIYTCLKKKVAKEFQMKKQKPGYQNGLQINLVSRSCR